MEGFSEVIVATAEADSPCGRAKKTSSDEVKSSGEKAEKLFPV